MRDERRARFERLFRAEADGVRAYALRRAEPDVADDVVAETFLIAWRRLDHVPDAPRPWLLAVARRVLANRRRGERRVVSLVAKLAQRETGTPDRGVAGPTDLRLAITEALLRLPRKEREAIELVAWEGLSPGEAARVLGCSQGTFRVRLHRARRRLWAALGDARGPDIGTHSKDNPVEVDRPRPLAEER